MCRVHVNCGGCWIPPWCPARHSSRVIITACRPTNCMVTLSTKCRCTKWTAAPPRKSCSFPRVAKRPAPLPNGPPLTVAVLVCLLLCYFCCWYSCYYCSLTADRASRPPYGALIGLIPYQFARSPSDSPLFLFRHRDACLLSLLLT